MNQDIPGQGGAPARRGRKREFASKSVIAVAWLNPYTTPPAEIDTINGKTRWACSVLDRAFEDEIRAEHAPEFRPGSGWCFSWSAISPPPKRWSPERKAKARRKCLRARIGKRLPLLVDQIEAVELGRRPHYYDPAAIEAGEDLGPSLSPYPDRPAKLPRLPRPEGRFVQPSLGLAADTAALVGTPGRTAAERAHYRARRYAEAMSQPMPAPVPVVRLAAATIERQEPAGELAA